MRLNIALCLIFLLPCVVYSAPLEDLFDTDDVDARVVGGYQSRSLYQVSVQKRVKLDEDEDDGTDPKKGVLEHYCGGSFINRLYVVTAAHCVDKMKPWKLRVVSNASQWAALEKKTVSTVKRFIIHENFTRIDGEPDADIALIELEEPVIFMNETQQVQLPGQGFPLDDNKRTTLTGWGKLDEDDEYIPADLHKAKLFVVNHDQCREKYKSIDKEITDNMFCAATEGKGPCEGDEGGPLLKGGTLYGITSWYHGCATNDFPGVYVQVSNFVDWIKQNTQIL